MAGLDPWPRTPQGWIGEAYAANSARLSESARSRGCRQGRVIVYCRWLGGVAVPGPTAGTAVHQEGCGGVEGNQAHRARRTRDRKSTRLNSSHLGISYAVFCLKKKKQYEHDVPAGATSSMTVT